ncbi:HpcH/HpaI aldolase family protein [Halobacillus naozhouensis]|uniref:Aldolase/citrate lyase family protein n=1 Tax=Halobacillus naozhouensis TaxID=554880 RepID=A0ABY8IZ91_9BACI|nr:aldolase/citrate lyase family protein [Halobacillus naozhouensis]WFT75569.1 aldolase/citrate lyase family protein [Halobacillus naozhouensis]
MGNILKEKINNGERVLGAFINMYAPSLVEIIGYAGFDFIIIDDEHGSFSSSELENMIRAAEIVNMAPVVRVSYNPSSIQKALDRGAKGIQVPMVNNEKEAKDAVEKAKYPPLGNRGTAFSIRPARFGKEKGKEYLEKANMDVLIVVHIETSEAVKNFREITSVPGIDVAFIGSTDLAVNMGYSGDTKHANVQKVIEDLFETGKRNGLRMGAVSGNEIGVIEGFSKGASYMGVVANSVIMSSLEKVAKSKKAEVSS